MKKYIVILLLLVGCAEEDCVKLEPTNCFMLKLSDALPVQFWLNGRPSFNQKTEAGIEKRCFFQPFNCEDDIEIQFTEDETSVYNPLILDPDDWTETSAFTSRSSVTFYSYLFGIGGTSHQAYQPYALGNAQTLKFKIYSTLFGVIPPSITFVMKNGVTNVSNTVVVTSNGEHEIELLTTGVADRLSVSVVLNNSLSTDKSEVIFSIIPYVKAYDFIVNDNNGDEVLNVPFERIPAETTLEVSSAAWIAAPRIANGGTVDWSGATVNLSFGSAGTKKSYLKYVPVAIAANQRVRLFIESGQSQFGTNITASSMTVGLYDAAFNLLASHTFNTPLSSMGITTFFEVENASNTPVAYFGVYTEATASGAGSRSTFLDYGRAIYNLYPDLAAFTKTLTPAEEDICNEYISLQINDDETDEMLYYTDLLDIQSLHANTRLIEYTNEGDFAGIIYDFDDEGSPVTVTPTFGIRVHSKFYEPNFPEENEGEDLGDGTVVKLSGSVKEQRLLEIEPLPPYMLKKLKLILQHNSLFIENQSWLKEENYEIDKLDDRYAFFSSSAMLTLKDDNYITNVF